MLEKISCTAPVHFGRFYLQEYKKKTATLDVCQNVEFAKILVANYQLSFLGRKYNNPNSKRKYIDYGKDLYIGSSSATVDRCKAKAKQAQLDNADLRNYNFRKANFYRACLQGANLENTNFEKANLYNVNMRNVTTCGTNFAYTNLNFADFTGANFGKLTDMRGANVIGAIFNDTNLDWVNFENALYNDTTLFPEGFSPKAEGMILLDDNSDLSNLGGRLEYAKMRFATLRNVNFKNSSLKRADMKKMDIRGCNFENVNLTRAYAPEIEAKNCSFKDAKMKQVNFDGAIFENVDMSNADLRGAIFTFDSAYGLKLNGARYDQFTLFNDNFNPKNYGMIYEESKPGVYGARAWEYGL